MMIGVGALGIGPALPDVIDATVNGTASGSGDLKFVCSLATPGCVQGSSGPPLFTVPYSFSGTNTDLGAFDASGSAASFPWSIEGFADQSTSATSDALSINLTGGYFVTAPFYSATESDQVSVSFDVTQESVIQLLGVVILGSASNGGELLDSDGNVILTVPLDSSSPISTVVQPGMYQLDASASASSFGSLADNLSVTNLNLILEADVTPVVPEPQWTVFAALLATILGGYAVSRRRRAL
jgi:hypothetical protein